MGTRAVGGAAPDERAIELRLAIDATGLEMPPAAPWYVRRDPDSGGASPSQPWPRIVQAAVDAK
jgi:hypothetical protein